MSEQPEVEPIPPAMEAQHTDETNPAGSPPREPQPEPEPTPDDDEVGNPAAQDTGDFAEAGEQADTDEGHPANEPVDLGDVTDDGQVVDVGAEEA